MDSKSTARFCRALTATLGAALILAGTAQASLGAPRLSAPGNHTTVQSLPAFTWLGVRGAAHYQFEFSATRDFSSGVNGFGSGPVTLDTTAITNNETIPDGTYYWRVRAVNKSDAPGRWSAARRLTKRWRTAPRLLSPAGTTVNWPASPLLLRWSAVPLAVNYQVEIGTSPQLSNRVYGPVDVQGPQFAVPTTLSPGTYYWAVRPIDASGHLGAQSQVKSFTWAWPSNTSLTESDASPDSTYEEPTFSWTEIPGASNYEVQVATDPSYPTNATILDATGIIGTRYTASHFFPNHTTLYWRVRARDARGDAGSWNDGESFTESFDQSVPSIQNLEVVDEDGNALNDPTTSDPIVRWSPVPGASAYTVTLAPWASGSGCDFNGGKTITTAATSWTLGATDFTDTWESQQYGWPGSSSPSNYLYFTNGTGGPACLSVIAIRSDSPLSGTTIESAPTVLGNTSAPAFTYQKSTPSGTLTSADTVTYSPGIVPPATGNGAVPAGSTLTTAPLFEWQPVAAADGYYVIVANDANFDPNSIVAGGYTNTTAWAPTKSLPDQTAAYWWEVIPVTANGTPMRSADNGSNGDPSTYNPQPFNKDSTPPALVSPSNGANVPTQPTFSWDSAQGAKSYTLQISADPSFASPIETDTTDSTSFTSSSTLPAGKTLYWRVRANDISYNLNWSAVQTFTHNLPAPLPLLGSGSGSGIPLMSWSPVTGASSYNVTVTTGDSSSTYSLPTPYLTPLEFFSPGLSTWQVQSVFPGGVTSAFSNAVSYKRTMPAPSGIHATKSGSRIVVTWKPDPIAKAYVIQLSNTTGFSSPIASATTQNTAWVPQITAQQAASGLYWRLAVVDHGGNIGAYHLGHFSGPHRGKAKHKGKPKKHGKHGKHGKHRRK